MSYRSKYYGTTDWMVIIHKIDGHFFSLCCVSFHIKEMIKWSNVEKYLYFPPPQLHASSANSLFLLSTWTYILLRKRLCSDILIQQIERKLLHNEIKSRWHWHWIEPFRFGWYRSFDVAQYISNYNFHMSAYALLFL